MNRFFNRYVSLHNAVLRSDEPGEDAGPYVNPFDALEDVGDEFQDDLAAVVAGEKSIDDVIKDKAESGQADDQPAAGQEDSPSPAPVTPPAESEAAAAPAPAPAAPDANLQMQQMLWQQQQQMMEMMRQQQQSHAPQKEEPKGDEDYLADWKAPAPDPNLSQDENMMRWLGSRDNHIARKVREQAGEAAYQRVQREFEPVRQYVQQQQQRQAWQQYDAALERTVAGAGYASGTGQAQVVKNAVHGLALQAQSMGMNIDDAWLARAAATIKQQMPPQVGPQGVVEPENKGKDAPLTGRAPAGGATPTKPPSMEAQQPKTLEDANAAMQASIANLFNKAG